MYVVDGHLDLAWNALQWERDLRLSVQTIRAREAATPGKGRALGTVALPEMREGKVALCLATVLARSTGTPSPHLDYPSAEQAHGVATGQLAYYRALERSGHLRVIRDREALEAHVAEWKAADGADGTASELPPPGVVISMESADPILDPSQLEDWWEAGLRTIGVSHYGPGRYAGGTGTDDGLTPQGRELLSEMQQLSFVLDLTHFSDPSFWQALDLYEGLVIASHNNCRTLVPHQRQISDDQLRAIIRRDGVIGAAFDAWMLRPGWIRDVSSPEGLGIGAVVDHIEHVCQLAGDSLHAAIGSDLDGGFGREQVPADLDTIADLQKVGELLAARGYSGEDVANVMHDNWLRVLRRALPQRLPAPHKDSR